MKQNLRNNSSGGSRLFDRFATEKKKTIIAMCLIAVMVFMWVKVLGRKGPKGDKAAATARGLTDSGTDSELKISFIELPKVKGRNDVLTRDFFTVDDWQNFVRDRERNSGSMEEVSVVSKDGSADTIKWVAEKLKLEAIILGENPRAFINDKLLSVGDKLFVRDGINTYECEIAEIKENMVFIRCGEAEITFRFTQASILDY